MRGELTKAQLAALCDLVRIDGQGVCYWARPTSCAQLAERGLAEQYTPPSVAERRRMKARPYRITDLGRAALNDQTKEGKADG